MKTQQKEITQFVTNSSFHYIIRNQEEESN